MRILTHLISITALAGLLAPAYGAIIDGSTLNFSGTFVAGAVSTTYQCNQPGDATCAVPPAGQGDIAVAGSTGTFAQYNGIFGLIKDTNNALEPLNQPFSLPNFITFDLNNNETVELTFLPLGTDTFSTTCAGLAHCTPQNFLLTTPSDPTGLTGFNLDSNLLGTQAVFGIQGILHDNSGQTGAISGTIMAQFVGLGLNPQQTLALLEAGGNVDYTGQLTVTVNSTATPEPATTALVALGFVGLALTKRNFKGLSLLKEEQE